MAVATGAAQPGSEGQMPMVRFDGFVSYSHAGDGLLAPRLQGGLQRFAKPWWRRRSLRIFRDESSLSANPHLWSSIVEALEASRWFILLTSPEAASSPWVDREVAWWLEHKGGERILPVLTDGDLVWDEGSQSLDSSSSVPPSLRAAFTEEPRWVDMRWARSDDQLDLGNSRFRGAVADIASTLRGVPKDDLESEEVRQHRRTLRTAWGAAGLLAVLTATATGAAFYANDQRQEADLQRTEAESQRAEAETQSVRAEAEADRALSAEALARSRELAASAINVLDDDPELSILLGLEAIDATPAGAEQPIETMTALREAVHSSKVRFRYEVADAGETWVGMALSPDGDRLAITSAAVGVLRLLDTATFETVWEHREAESSDTLANPFFSPDGRLIAVGVLDAASKFADSGRSAMGDDGLPARVVIVDASSGEILTTIEYPICPSSQAQAFSPDGRWLAVTTAGAPDCDQREDIWRVELLDTSTWQIAHAFETSYFATVSWSADGSRMSYTPTEVKDGSTVIDLTTLTPIVHIPSMVDGVLSPDGTRLVGNDPDGFRLKLFDVATGSRLDNLAGLPDFASQFQFTTDGTRLIAGSEGASVVVWDLVSGEILQSLPGAGFTTSIAYHTETDILYHGSTDGTVTKWDLSGSSEGEFDTVATHHWVQGNAIAATENHGAFMAFDLLSPGQETIIWPFDGSTGKLGDQRRVTHLGVAPGVLPDGRVVLADARGSHEGQEAEWGPAVVWDPIAGSVEELFGCWAGYPAIVDSNFGETPITCEDRDGEWIGLNRAFTSPDGSTLLLQTWSEWVYLFDARTLEPRGESPLPGDIIAFGGDWVLAIRQPTTEVVDLVSGDVLLSLPFGPFAAVSRDGQQLAVSEFPGSVTVLDTSTWTIVSHFEATTARLRGLEFSPDGSTLMTAGTDGFVRIWETATGGEVARIPLTGASDAHWIDQAHMVVGTSEGLWTRLTLDVDELRELAQSRLTRDFTPEECKTYRVEPCNSGAPG